MKKTYSVLIILSALFLAACSTNEEAATESDNLQVVATFYPMYEFASQVGGDAVDVSLMIPAGSGVHSYEPSARDLATLETADAFVYANAEMETFVPTVLESLDTDTLTVVEADADIELLETAEEDSHDHDHNHEEEHGHSHDVDPHTWVDPANAIIQVTEIKDAFVEADPDNAAIYEENAAAYIEELEALQAEYDEALGEVTQNQFITQHAAFGYLAERYGLIQHSLAGISADNEASPQRMAEVVTLIEEARIPVVYYNTNESTSLAETVAAEAGVDTAALHTLESLTEDEINDGQNYISIMRDNLESLKLAIN